MTPCLRCVKCAAGPGLAVVQEPCRWREAVIASVRGATAICADGTVAQMNHGQNLRPGQRILLNCEGTTAGATPGHVSRLPPLGGFVFVPPISRYTDALPFPNQEVSRSTLIGGKGRYFTAASWDMQSRVVGVAGTGTTVSSGRGFAYNTVSRTNPDGSPWYDMPALMASLLGPNPNHRSGIPVFVKAGALTRATTVYVSGAPDSTFDMDTEALITGRENSFAEVTASTWYTTTAYVYNGDGTTSQITGWKWFRTFELVYNDPQTGDRLVTDADQGSPQLHWIEVNLGVLMFSGTNNLGAMQMGSSAGGNGLEYGQWPEIVNPYTADVSPARAHTPAPPSPQSVDISSYPVTANGGLKAIYSYQQSVEIPSLVVPFPEQTPTPGGGGGNLPSYYKSPVVGGQQIYCTPLNQDAITSGSFSLSLAGTTITFPADGYHSWGPITFGDHLGVVVAQQDGDATFYEALPGGVQSSSIKPLLQAAMQAYWTAQGYDQSAGPMGQIKIFGVAGPAQTWLTHRLVVWVRVPNPFVYDPSRDYNDLVYPVQLAPFDARRVYDKAGARAAGYALPPNWKPRVAGAPDGAPSHLHVSAIGDRTSVYGFYVKSLAFTFHAPGHNLLFPDGASGLEQPVEGYDLLQFHEETADRNLGSSFTLNFTVPSAVYPTPEIVWLRIKVPAGGLDGLVVTAKVGNSSQTAVKVLPPYDANGWATAYLSLFGIQAGANSIHFTSTAPISRVALSYGRLPLNF